MRESLLTIPINEVFEPKCGCPICRMRDNVENHIAEYIMGAAMMEPDVRQETNALGFCTYHYNELMKQNNRLSLGLMLNSHLALMRQEIFEKKGLFFSKNAKAKKASEIENTCFICEKTDWGIDRMLETVFTMFKDVPTFRTLYNEQEFICVPHYNLLMQRAQTKLQKGDLKAFEQATDTLVEKYLYALNSDVAEFCDSFDYRNAGKLHKPEMEHVRTSVERAIEFLTSRKAITK